jgi:hypothetical protein
MQNGQNRDSFRSDDIENEVWKPRYDGAADRAVNNWVRVWELSYCLKALPNCHQELVPEFGAL